MDFRLLVDADAIDFLHRLPPQQRRRLYLHFREIQKFPANHSQFVVRDEDGRRLDVSNFESFRVYYWTDGADRHVKILQVSETD